MSMVSNKIEVMLLTQEGEKLYWELCLDNEISTELTGDENLFNSASSVKKFVESIGKGFKDPFFDDEDEDEDEKPDPDFIKQYCQDFSAEYDYNQLKKLIRKYAQKESCIKVFKKVVLMSDNQYDNYREYNYNVFDLENNKFKSGCGEASLGDNYYYDPEDCNPKSEEFMESLI